jgi:hypothetical protein
VRRGARAWVEILQRQRESGLSEAAFCAAEGLVLSTLQRWRRVLGARQGARASGASPEAGGEALFAPLSLAGADAVQAVRRGGGDWQVELELGAGVVLRLARVTPC